MKGKCLFIILFFINITLFSQTWKELTKNQSLDSSPKNELSAYFKKEIPKKLLRNVRYNSKQDYITLSFYINKEQKPFGITFSSFINKELNEKIKESFKKYTIEKLNLDTLNKSKQYFFQIITKKGRKNIINCSNKIFTRTLPNCSSYNDLENYKDIKVCIEKKIKKYFTENIDFSRIKRFESEKNYNIDLDLFVDEQGNLNFKKLKGSVLFLESIENAVKAFPKFDTPATLNNEKTIWNSKTKFSFNKNSLPTWKENNCNFDSIFKRNSTNDFALYLKTKITEKDLEKANLNRMNKSVTLNFELDEKDKPFNIRTNARSNYLDKLITSSFKNYPIEKLFFHNKKSHNYYFTQILALENDKIIIKTNGVMGYESVPVFPGCENSKSITDAKNCFSKGVQMHFARKFNADIPNELGLSKGRKRILIKFKINKEGKMSDIDVKAPHIKLIEEVVNVMKRLPRIKPGTQAGKPVIVKYTIPFTIIVQ